MITEDPCNHSFSVDGTTAIDRLFIVNVMYKHFLHLLIFISLIELGCSLPFRKIKIITIHLITKPCPTRSSEAHAVMGDVSGSSNEQTLVSTSSSNILCWSENKNAVHLISMRQMIMWNSSLTLSNAEPAEIKSY